MATWSRIEGNPLSKAVSAVAAPVKATVRAFEVTLRSLWSKPVTIQYPEERKEMYTRTRWRHRLLRHDDGMERCIGCSLCAAACPAHCIYVEAEENTEEQRYSPGERYAKVYEINLLRCIFCGYCQDACPTEAIVLREEYELADYRREDFLYTKERLLHP